MKITQTNYYQINKNHNITSSKGYANTFKMGINKPLQAVEGVEKTVQQTGLFTKIKTFLAGSFLAGLFGLVAKKDESRKSKALAKAEEAVRLEAEARRKAEEWEKFKAEARRKQAEKELLRKKVFELETILDKPYLLQSFFKKYPNIDLNVKDENGDTLFLKLVRNRMLWSIQDLIQAEKQGLIKNVDKNAVDANGNNALIIIQENIEKGHYATKPEDIKLLLNAGVNPNYIKTSDRFHSYYCTPLQRAIIGHNHHLIDIYLENKKTDINLSHPYTPPPLFLCVTRHHENYYALSSILKHPDCDVFQKYKGMNILEYLNSQPNMELSFVEKAATEINAKIMLHIFDKAKKYYQEKGIFDLEQLDEYSKHPGFKTVVNKPLNKIGENIGHFLSDINTDDYEELIKIRDLIITLKKCSFDFTKTDKLGRTPLMKAIEAENANLVHLLFDYGTDCGNSLIKATNLGLKSKNKDIKAFFERWKKIYYDNRANK